MRKEMLQHIHDGHQRITKCRNRTREAIWSPGLSTEIEELVRNCPACIKETTDAGRVSTTTVAYARNGYIPSPKPRHHSHTGLLLNIIWDREIVKHVIADHQGYFRKTRNTQRLVQRQRTAISNCIHLEIFQVHNRVRIWRPDIKPNISAKQRLRRGSGEESQSKAK